MKLPLNNYYQISHHYNAYTEAIVAVFNGKTLFINHFNQYGFYPYFLVLLFKVFDFNIRNFSILMITMLTIANIANLVTLLITIKNKLTALLIFTNILFFTMLYTYYYSEGKRNFLDYYYQYFPHRYFFPAIIIFLFVMYIKNNQKAFYCNLFFCLLIITASISILWNIETGVICYISCIVGNLYFYVGKIKKSKWEEFFRIIIFLFIVPVLSLVILQMITYIRVKSLVQIVELFQFIKFFYSSGFAMIPMKAPHTWILIVLIYAVGIIVSAINISMSIYSEEYKEGPEHQINTYIFLISVMGIGLFSYYQGRSHDANLFKVIPYAFLVLGLLIDNYNEVFRNRTNNQNKNLLIIKGILFLIPISFLMDMNKTINILNMKPIENRKEISNEEIKKIEEYLKPDEKIIILSSLDNESYISMSLKRSNSIANSSLVEMFYKKDYGEFLYKLFNNKDEKVLLDKNFPYIKDVYPDLMLSGKYKLIFEGEKFFLLEYDKSRNEKEEIFETNIRKNYANDKLIKYFWTKDSFIFSDSKDNILNNNFLDKNRKKYIDFLGKSIKINYPEEFSIDLIIQPRNNKNNIPYATIIGNHSDFLGFVIMRNNLELNTYIVTYGTGKSWVTTDSFYLKNEQKQYLSIVFAKNKIFVYLDGELIVENNFEENYVDSEIPTYVGNWQGEDRVFDGTISEVAIISKVLTPAEIKENWLNFKKALNEKK
jgi:hypothetical protein